MYLGTRKIRSAGRNSGSIEITLPTTLQVLEGIPCRLTVRDGPRPEIILHPDLAAAHSLFQLLWQKVRTGLGDIGDLPDFSLADFNLAFFPPQHWQERPPLAYVDALIVLRDQSPLLSGGKNIRLGEEDALARLLALLAMTAALRFGLQGRFATSFGDAVAYLMTGSSTSLGTDFERGMAYRLFWGENHAPSGCIALDDQSLLQQRPAFRRVFDQFHAWQAVPTTCTAARDAWYRALTVELKSL